MEHHAGIWKAHWHLFRTALDTLCETQRSESLSFARNLSWLLKNVGHPAFFEKKYFYCYWVPVSSLNSLFVMWFKIHTSFYCTRKEAHLSPDLVCFFFLFFVLSVSFVLIRWLTTSTGNTGMLTAELNSSSWPQFVTCLTTQQYICMSESCYFAICPIWMRVLFSRLNALMLTDSHDVAWGAALKVDAVCLRVNLTVYSLILHGRFAPQFIKQGRQDEGLDARQPGQTQCVLWACTTILKSWG